MRISVIEITHAHSFYIVPHRFLPAVLSAFSSGATGPCMTVYVFEKRANKVTTYHVRQCTVIRRARTSFSFAR